MVLGAGKSKVRMAPDLFVWWRLFSVSKMVPLLRLPEEKNVSFAENRRAGKPLLKRLEPYLPREHPLWTHYLTSLEGAHCSHALWLACISSPLTWLPPSHGPDYISNVISEQLGLASSWATSAFTRRRMQHGYAHILISVREATILVR